MKLRSITEIEPKPSRCIEVNSNNRLFAAGGENGNSIISHNSVVQRNIIFSCILRPDHWRFVGIDLKKVELSAFREYKNVVLGIATELEDAITVLKFAQETMMNRYKQMEELGVNNFINISKKTGEKPGQALLVMVDEAGELLSPGGVKALSENTIIPLSNGTTTTLKNLQIGDEILDNYSQPTKITRKYEPIEQERYNLIISKDKTNEKENIIAGKEHLWVAYFIHPDGTTIGPETVNTEYLYNFKQSQMNIDPEKRIDIKFKKFVS